MDRWSLERVRAASSSWTLAPEQPQREFSQVRKAPKSPPMLTPSQAPIFQLLPRHMPRMHTGVPSCRHRRGRGEDSHRWAPHSPAVIPGAPIDSRPSPSSTAPGRLPQHSPARKQARGRAPRAAAPRRAKAPAAQESIGSPVLGTRKNRIPDRPPHRLSVSSSRADSPRKVPTTAGIIRLPRAMAGKPSFSPSRSPRPRSNAIAVHSSPCCPPHTSR